MSHTHWDREWYHPAERFRQRLVALIDELLDEPAGSFLLDGQAIVLEDYLDVKPERAAELAAALREGTLEAGPWYVLADELIPSGEGLVRNLLAGRRVLRALRAESPPVLYCPDSFGHPAALPAIARGFGKDVVILWRGFGGPSHPRGDAFHWHAPDGERVVLYHLTRSGYELGANLPADLAAARERWTRLRDEFAWRSTTGLALLLNGADHHARQRNLADALATLREVAQPDDARPASLAAFARDIAGRAAGRDLPRVDGELRDSYGYTWTLQGTLGARAPQKRRYVRAERELVRDVEPWIALAARHRGSSRRHLAHAAWRPLLRCQPHDTLCGCSIDAVARAMDARLDAVETQAAGLREEAIFSLIGHAREAARTAREKWTPIVLIRNAAARGRGGVAIVELDTTIGDVPVGPGSDEAHGARDVALPPPPKLEGLPAIQVLERAVVQDRTEAPRAYPDNDAVARVRAAVWVPEVPPYGLTAYAHTRARAAARPDVTPVAVTKDSLSNGQLTVRVAADGDVAVEQQGRSLTGLLAWESREDAGDLYTPSIRGGEQRLAPRLLSTRIAHRGPWRGALEQRWRLLGSGGRVDLRVRLVLDAGTEWLRLQVIGDNAANDHRLRLIMRTDVDTNEAVADTAFGVVRRSPVAVTREQSPAETPLPTAPLHRYVSLFDATRGATLFSDGLTEYEARAGAIAVTLLRSVGELSRRDLPERPGHAGWPAPTPAAQCAGAFEAELALMLHGPRTRAVISAIERAADDVLWPLNGTTLRSALRVPPPVRGIGLEGVGLAFSSAKESDDGAWLVLRCINLLDADVLGTWRVGDYPVSEAQLARLDETPQGQLEIRDGAVRFAAPPHGIVTVLVR